MKKRLMMVMCCGIMILGNLSGCNAMKTKETEYHWPTSTLVKSLPVPESKYGEIVLDAEDSFEIDVFNTSKSQFADYINACKENGFNVDYYGTEDSYDAENKDGYTLSLSYDKRKKTMNIDIYDPIPVSSLLPALPEDHGYPSQLYVEPCNLSLYGISESYP